MRNIYIYIYTDYYAPLFQIVIFASHFKHFKRYDATVIILAVLLKSFCPIRYAIYPIAYLMMIINMVCLNCLVQIMCNKMNMDGIQFLKINDSRTINVKCSRFCWYLD